MDTSVSRALADTLARARFTDFSPAVIDAASRAVLDWLGSALAGAFEPPARMAQRVASMLGHCDDATVFAAGRSSAAGAAFANGVASHILELDDVHKGSTLHAAAPVIPAALSIAEREHSSGKAFLTAVIAGYDAALRVGEAVNPTHYRYWHPTGTAATFGAAAAAGSLLGLDAAQMLDAFGSAGTQAAGLWEFNADGSMSKHLHPGKAAMNGVLAADLAQEGFTGAKRILEGDRGFFRSMSASHDASRITDRLGAHWKIVENCYKIWSCCGHTHSAIDIACKMRAQQQWDRAGAVNAIESIQLETYAAGYDIVKNARPTTPYEAKFSLAYCVAAALVSGGVSLEEFADGRFGGGRVHDDAINALLERIHITVADDLTAKYPGAWPSRVHITLRDGTVLTDESNYPVGNPENPVTTPQLEEKFLALVAPRWGESDARRAIACVHAIASQGDMSGLLREFAGVVHAAMA